jgi:PAS domain S-box-containing protein
VTKRQSKGGASKPAAEDEFDESGMKYRDFLEGVGAAIFAIDLEGRFLFINGRALQLLGYPEDAEGELVGEHFSKIMAPEQAPAAVTLLQSGREVRPAVLEALRKDGSPVKLEVSGAWVKRRGRRVGALAMAWEVGAAKAGMEQEFSKLDMTILQLLSSGLSNREIAQRVYLSTHTIKDRIERMMRYFDVHRRTELAAKAARQGLV